MSIENDIKAEWRLFAVETVVSVLLAAPFLAQGESGLALFEAQHQAILDSARKKTFPNVDPALSDHFSGELESAVDRLLGMAKAYLLPPPASEQ